MALTKQTITDKIESVRVQDYYVLQVREAIQVLENNNVISQNYHRYVLNPDTDVSTISDPVVKAQFEAVMGDKEKQNFSNYNKKLEKDRLAREAKEQEESSE